MCAIVSISEYEFTLTYTFPDAQRSVLIMCFLGLRVEFYLETWLVGGNRW